TTCTPYAKQLLAEAGYPNGFEAGDYICDASFTDIAEPVLNDLQKVGVCARLGCANSSERRSTRATPRRHSRTSSKGVRQRCNPVGGVRSQRRHVCIWQRPRA